jgi:hypothetical protein
MRPALSSLCISAALVALSTAGAEAGSRRGERYYFAVTSVERGEGQPEMLEAMVAQALVRELERREQTLHELPAAAPDPKKSPDAFKQYLRKHRLRAFDVRVEIKGYTRTLEPAPQGETGQRLGVSIALHLFGETMPDRTMAFAGDGAAAIKLEIGSTVRERDDEVAHHDAIEVAATEAVDAALAKLRAPPPSQKPKQHSNEAKTTKG